MSEQQKNSDVSGVASGDGILSDSSEAAQLKTARDGTAVDKPKRRSAAKAKVALGVDAQPTKPRRTRSAKAGNILVNAAASSDIEALTGQGQSDSPRRDSGDLPPLPAAPVPTSEGIAFMQQHVAYQRALDERTKLERARLEQTAQGSKDTSSPVVQQIAAAGEQSDTLKDQKAGSRDNVAAEAPAAVRSGNTKQRNSKENSIEDGRSIRKTAVSEADLQSVDDPNDARVFRQLEAKPVVKQVSTATSAAVGAGASVETSDGRAPLTSTAIPESVRKRFFKVDSDYFFPDRSPAFVDRGARLATRGEHPEVVRALVEIAIERGWSSVTVKGSEAFRRAAWMEAARNGMQIAGYKPTDLDLAQLRQREPNNSIEPGPVRDQSVTGPVPLAKSADEHQKHRTLDEKLSAFANDRPTLVVKKYPELVQAYALLDAARKFSEVYMPGHEDKFVAIGRELITQQIRNGREVTGPRIDPDQLSQSRAGQQRPSSTIVKDTQDQEVARER